MDNVPRRCTPSLHFISSRHTMQVFSLLPLLATLLAASGVSAGTFASASTTLCAREVVTYETFVGRDQNVKLQYSHCDDAPHVKVIGLDKRQTLNVCSAPC